MKHLDASTLDALLKNPRAHAELIEHLKTDCEVCDRFLSEHEGPGLLDGLTDAALLSASKLTRLPNDERGFDAVMKAMRPAAASRRWMIAAAAALLLAVMSIGLWRARDDGLKGRAHVTLELQAARADADRVERLSDGQSVPASGSVLLRYHASDETRAWVLIEREGRPSEKLGPFKLLSGTHDLSDGDTPLGLPLSGEVGKLTVRLWAVDAALESAPRIELHVDR
jgi:hypothetical protein